jgi:hypothetical protein
MIGLLMKLLFGDMLTGQVEHRRIFHRYDMAKNRTIIVVAGPLDARRLEGAKEVLGGKAHARKYPGKCEAVPFGECAVVEPHSVFGEREA